MKRSLPILLSLVLLASSSFVRAQTDAEVEARKTALDLAGAFANDGFKTRDGHWCGTVKPHDQALVAVNLYAGNQYWFSAGASQPSTKIAVNVYDETGKQIPTETHNTGDKAAAGFAPESSGQYFVSVDLLEGQEGSFCLLYSYK
jgi:hypothetical protein